MMNTDSTFGTAVLRGAYNFVGTAMTAGITCYLAMQGVVGDTVSTGDIREVSVLTGLLGGLAALGFRGGVEGFVDNRRQNKNDVKPSDVQVS